MCRLHVALADTPAYYTNTLYTRGVGGKLPVIAVFVKRRFAGA